MIPHQKFGAGFYFPLTEEQRALSHEIKYIQDPEAMRALYGIAKTRYEAEKFLNRTNKDELLAAQNTAISLDRKQASNRSGANQSSGGSKSSVDEEVVEKKGQMIDLVLVMAPSPLTSLASSSAWIPTSSTDLRRSKLLCKRISALGIPPLPPDLGALVQPTLVDGVRPQHYNGYIDALDLPANEPRQQLWKPKEGVLMASLQEHTKAVNRIAVCPDQSYFGSASADGTVKIWQLRGMDSDSSASQRDDLQEAPKLRQRHLHPGKFAFYGDL